MCRFAISMEIWVQKEIARFKTLLEPYNKNRNIIV